MQLGIKIHHGVAISMLIRTHIEGRTVKGVVIVQGSGRPHDRCLQRSPLAGPNDCERLIAHFSVETSRRTEYAGAVRVFLVTSRLIRVRATVEYFSTLIANTQDAFQLQKSHCGLGKCSHKRMLGAAFESAASRKQTWLLKNTGTCSASAEDG